MEEYRSRAWSPRRTLLQRNQQLTDRILVPVPPQHGHRRGSACIEVGAATTPAQAATGWSHGDVASGSAGGSAWFNRSVGLQGHVWNVGDGSTMVRFLLSMAPTRSLTELRVATLEKAIGRSTSLLAAAIWSAVFKDRGKDVLESEHWRRAVPLLDHHHSPVVKCAERASGAPNDSAVVITSVHGAIQ